MISDNPMRSRGNKGALNDSNNSSGNSNMYNNNRFGGDIEGGRNRNGRAAGFNDANSNILEQQNNERIDLLSDQVARLKGLTIEIG
jgi:blocked-early-in-transport protein 1